MDLEKWIVLLKTGKHLPESDLRSLCKHVSDLLSMESNVHPVCSPVTICACLYGQLDVLKHILSIGGQLPQTNYIFLGDYMDYGKNSVETFSLLLALKAKYPNNITLLRGAEEDKFLTADHGTRAECVEKYGNDNMWRLIYELFPKLPISALVDESVFCVRGGLSPEIKTLDDILTVDRQVHIPLMGPLAGLTNSDPVDYSEGFSNRTVHGHDFGSKVTEEFMERNKLTLICKSAERLDEGYKWWFGKRIIAIYSNPNLIDENCNDAAILLYRGPENYEVKVFKSSLNED